jgi:hypothetical protein
LVIVISDARPAKHLAGRSTADGFLYDREIGRMLWNATDFNHEGDAKNAKLSITPLAAFSASSVMNVSFEDAIARLIKDHELPR